MKSTMSLREAIIYRVKDNSRDELREVIQDSVGNAEVLLPGLGVLFEMIWTHSPDEDRERMVKVLYEQIHKDDSAKST
ncbi:small acid-soluble spore protein SspI [Cohnella laeviribosi]|uniref:small acid-soluble spore protein SspI n=1 Tax=Cohnella laeviribosi TaxID=380174 RepID=UPI00035FC207|nr:small acid-soluble spore protein SspI [Cohnella laeviribosi]